jgi:hypothetical protein
VGLSSHSSCCDDCNCYLFSRYGPSWES